MVGGGHPPWAKVSEVASLALSTSTVSLSWAGSVRTVDSCVGKTSDDPDRHKSTCISGCLGEVGAAGWALYQTQRHTGQEQCAQPITSAGVGEKEKKPPGLSALARRCSAAERGWRGGGETERGVASAEMRNDERRRDGEEMRGGRASSVASVSCQGGSGWAPGGWSSAPSRGTSAVHPLRDKPAEGKVPRSHLGSQRHGHV